MCVGLQREKFLGRKNSIEFPLGVCSIYHKENPIIICPVRFREDWIIISDAAGFIFNNSAVWSHVGEIRLNDLLTDNNSQNLNLKLSRIVYT